MKKVFSLLLVISAIFLSVAAAEIRLDYDLMTEEELLQLIDEIAEKVESYGYTVTVQKQDNTQVTDIALSGELEATEQDQDVKKEYPISISYIRVTNKKGLSSKKDCTVCFKSTCEKEIRRVYFKGTCYNRVDEYCGTVNMPCTGPFNNGDAYSSFYQADLWSDNAASYIVLTEVRIVFMDNTEITIDNPDEIDRLFAKTE